MTIPSTGEGHLLVGYAEMANSGVAIASVSDNVGNTWYHPAGGGEQPSAQCAASDSTAGSIDCAFVLSATAGVTSVSFSFSANSGGAVVSVYEVAYTNGPLGYELPYAIDQSASSVQQPGPTLNLRSANDFIIQGIKTLPAVNAINGGYVLAGSTAYLANSTNGTAPQWTLSSASTAAVSAIAFAESFGVVPGLNDQWLAYSRALTGGCAEPANVGIADGVLQLTAALQQENCDSIDLAEQSFNYSTHEIQMRTFNFLYGTVEFRTQVGGGANAGAWPIFEMYDSGCQMSDPTGTDNNCNGQEVDIAEFIGTVDTVNQQIHVDSRQHNDGCTPSLADASENFHIYDLIWSPGSLAWQVDGITTCTVTASYVPDAPMYLKINMWMGSLAGQVDNGSLPWTTQVDYVKILQNGSTIFYDDFTGGAGPVISSASTAPATVGTAFSYQISASNAPSSYGAEGLPPNLTINPSTGLISGTPTTSGTFNVVLSATNAAGTGYLMLTLTVAPAPNGVPVITSSPTATGAVGTSFAYQITATNSPGSFGASGLPSFLTLNPATGVISGVPNVTGSWTIGLSATNATGTGTLNLTFTSNPAAAVSFVQIAANASSGSTSSFAVTFPANTLASDLILVGFDFDNSVTPTVTDSQGNVFTQVGTELTSPGGTRSRVYFAPNTIGGADTVTVSLSGVSDYLEVYSTEYSGADLSNPIDAKTGASGGAGSVSSGSAITTASGDVIFGYCVADWSCTAGSGFNTRSTFNDNLIEDMTAAGPGAYTATANATNGWSMHMVAIKPVDPPGTAPVINSSNTAGGTVGVAFSYQITATNTPTQYGASGLPSFLTVNTSTGAITGTPTATGSWMVGLSATNAGGTGTLTLTITINPAAPAINSSNSAGGTVGVAFSYQITATNTPTQYGASGLPGFLTVNTSTGAITGTPTATGSWMVGLSATNAGGTGTLTLTITTNAGPSVQFVQVAANASSGSTNSFAVAFNANTLASDLILVAFDFDNDVTATVTDSQGNSFTQVGTELTSPGATHSQVFFAPNIKGGADTVTISLSGISDYLEVYLTEYSGADLATPIDAQAGNSGGAGFASSGNATTTVAGDVIFGYCLADWSCTAGSGFNTRSMFNDNLIEDITVGMPGPYAATGSANNGWSLQMVAVKPAM